MITEGFCDPKFEGVRDLVEERLASGKEIGASLCVNIDGKNILDIWGGHADMEKTRPWEEDTLTVVYSCTKIVTGLAAIKLIDQGLLDPEERVTKYWPEFGVNGKEDVRVWQILSHCSGLPTWKEPVTTETVCDTKTTTEMLERQALSYPPGSAPAYQLLTHGHLIGELVRRVSGRPLKQFIAEEIAGPLDADFSLGVTEDKWARTADMSQGPALNPPEDLDPQGLIYQAVSNPLPDSQFSMNPIFRAAEVGAINGFGNARSMARIGSMVSLKGKVDGKQHLSPETVDQMVQERIKGTDLILCVELRMALGAALPSSAISFLPDGNIYFWTGWGGSVLIMDLDRRMTIGYAMNKMLPGFANENSEAYVKAIYEIMGTTYST